MQVELLLQRQALVLYAVVLKEGAVVLLVPAGAVHGEYGVRRRQGHGGEEGRAVQQRRVQAVDVRLGECEAAGDRAAGLQVKAHADGEIGALVGDLVRLAAGVAGDGLVQRLGGQGDDVLVGEIEGGDAHFRVAAEAAVVHAQVHGGDLLGRGHVAQQVLAVGVGQRRHAKADEQHRGQHAQGGEQAAQFARGDELIDEVDSKAQHEQRPEDDGVAVAQAPVLRGEYCAQHKEQRQGERAAVDVLQKAVGGAVAGQLRRAQAVQPGGQGGVEQAEDRGVERARAVGHHLRQAQAADGAEGEELCGGGGGEVQAEVEEGPKLVYVEYGRDAADDAAGEHADKARQVEHDPRHHKGGKERAGDRDAQQRAAQHQQGAGGKVEELAGQIGGVEGAAAEQIGERGGKQGEQYRAQKVAQHRRAAAYVQRKARHGQGVVEIRGVAAGEVAEGGKRQRHRRDKDEQEERRGELVDLRLRRAAQGIQQRRHDGKEQAQRKVDAAHEAQLAQRLHIQAGVEEAVVFHVRLLSGSIHQRHSRGTPSHRGRLPPGRGGAPPAARARGRAASASPCRGLRARSGWRRSRAL